MRTSYLSLFATTVLDSFQTVWVGMLQLLPNILAAAVVLIFGWLAASGLGKLVQRAVEFTKVDEAIDKAGLDRSLSESGIDFNLGKLIGWLAKWFVLVVVMIAVADILKLPQITDFLKTVALFIPNIIIAVVILLVGFVLGNFTYKVVEQSIRASKLSATSGVLAALAKWSIIVFAFLAALTHLNIAKELIQTLFTGLVGMLALAGGLAFGLGGKDEAKEMLSKIKREMKQ
jgi:small-conductance mechanosensitive channel